MLNLFLYKEKKEPKNQIPITGLELRGSSSVILIDEDKLREEANELVNTLKKNHNKYKNIYWKAYAERNAKNISYSNLKKIYGINPDALRQMNKRINDELVEKLKNKNYSIEEIEEIISFIFEKIEMEE